MSDEAGIPKEQAAMVPEGYDACFRKQLKSALREADDPDAPRYTLEERNEKIRLLKAAQRANNSRRQVETRTDFKRSVRSRDMLELSLPFQ